MQEYSADDIKTTFSDAGFLGILRVKVKTDQTVQMLWHTAQGIISHAATQNMNYYCHYLIYFSIFRPDLSLSHVPTEDQHF